MPTGISIHVGLNHLNEVHYKGRHSLAGCLRDAEAMHALAQAAGFEARLVTGENATAQAVLDAIEEARPRLGSDGMLLVTYSGHGGHVPDLAEHGPEHDRFDQRDRSDETWCLYDRQLLDDELYACWGGFSRGARVLVVSDSCFSGGMIRVARKRGAGSGQIRAEGEVEEEVEVEGGEEGEVKRPARRRTLFRTELVPESLQVAQAADEAAPPPRGDRQRGGKRGGAHGGAAKTRALTGSQSRTVYFRNRTLYKGIRNTIETAPPRPVAAEVVVLSAARDNQAAMDGDHNGAFTAALLEVWNGGAFQGDYVDLHRELWKRLAPVQHPQLLALRLPAFIRQRPFTI